MIWNNKEKFFVPVLIIALGLTSCSNNQGKLIDQEKDQYLKKGTEITSKAASTLSTQLKGAMAEGGIENAIQYCNLMANPLVDSLKTLYKAEIRRTTLQARNSGNLPAINEKKMLLAYQNDHELKQELIARIEMLEDGSIAYYAPIMVNSPLCLNCHGEPGKTMTYENNELIKSLYPDDEAIGYHEGDFRGIWSITFR